MKPLSHYSKKMIEYKEQPHELSALLLVMASDYGAAMQDRIEMETKKAEFWIERKDIGAEKPVSDKTLEMLFLMEASGVGKTLNRCILYLKGLEKLMSSVRTHLRILETEARNSF